MVLEKFLYAYLLQYAAMGKKDTSDIKDALALTYESNNVFKQVEWRRTDTCPD